MVICDIVSEQLGLETLKRFLSERFHYIADNSQSLQGEVFNQVEFVVVKSPDDSAPKQGNFNER